MKKLGQAEGEMRQGRYLGLRRCIPAAILQPAERSERGGEKAPEDPCRQDASQGQCPQRSHPALPRSSKGYPEECTQGRAWGEMCLRPDWLVISRDQEGGGVRGRDTVGGEDTGSRDLNDLSPLNPAAPMMSGGKYGKLKGVDWYHRS